MKLITFCLLCLLAVAASAAPIRFDFEFEDSVSGARAVGYIILEDNLLMNPTSEVNLPASENRGGVGYYTIPDPVIIDLFFTVTGSTGADGTYNLSDYGAFVFQTNSGLLNLLSELVGQATVAEPWGTSQDEGIAGDFNLFAGQIAFSELPNYAEVESSTLRGGLAPSGCWWFTLCTAGDTMVLVSMRGTPVVAEPVPVNSNWSMLILTFMSLLIGYFVIRKS